MKSFISPCNIDEILYNIDVPGGLNAYSIGNPIDFPVNSYNIFTSIPMVPDISYLSSEIDSNWWTRIIRFFIGSGYPFQAIVSTGSYIVMAVGSIFDKDWRDDMNRIDWNPFNSDESLVVKSEYISYYKGMPVFRRKEYTGSFSYGIIGLSRTHYEDTLKHEYGHSIQQRIMGPMKYGLYIALPSKLSWGPWGSSNSEYSPWEINATILGGAELPKGYTERDISRGWQYLWTATFLGPLAYLYLLVDY